ncbi:MAG TPA: SGNH/GDSL hydrolase family protein [Polyangiaceae bacterium]|nr:SGNH/GDSL hydrolase family protein [Polyangiaceae bacterium]
MRRAALASLLSLAAGSLDGPLRADEPTPEAPPVVQFVGRFDTSDPSGPRFAWSASAISTRFSGTSVSVRIRDDGTNELQVLVDGAPRPAVATVPGRDLYELATGLAPGHHELTISKRTEAVLGEMQFLGFVPEPGGALEPPHTKPRKRRIEFIGDSITAGYGNEGTSPTCPFSAKTENEFLTYAAIAARNLKADHVTLAWSGKTIEGMAQLWDRTLPARADSRWDFGSWVPDVVVVNLGTNDFFRPDLHEPAFVTPYVALLGQIRTRYPGAFIVCAMGPMVLDTYPPGANNLSRMRRFLRATVDAVHAQGDRRVAMIEFPVQDPATSACGFHPSLRVHRQMARLLTGEIKRDLRW